MGKPLMNAYARLELGDISPYPTVVIVVTMKYTHGKYSSLGSLSVDQFSMCKCHRARSRGHSKCHPKVCQITLRRLHSVFPGLMDAFLAVLLGPWTSKLTCIVAGTNDQRANAIGRAPVAIPNVILKCAKMRCAAYVPSSLVSWTPFWLSCWAPKTSKLTCFIA